MPRGTRDNPLFLAALSGGADSTAMTAALASIRDAGAAFSFRCLHVNHNIRSAEECSADEQAVISLCKTFSVPLRICRATSGSITAFAARRRCGLEAAARYFRRRVLKNEVKRTGADAILTAHTKDDLLETVLMAVLRGSGPAGLGAMRAAVPERLRSGTVPIIRPLLELGRNDVLSYLACRGISWRNDPSNADIRFLRNRVRHVLIPLLDREFTFWRRALPGLHKTQAMTADFLAAEAEQRLPWRREGEEIILPTGVFFAQNPVLREEALFTALDAAGGMNKPYRRTALAPFIKGRQSACDLGNVRVENRNGKISVKTVRRTISTKMFSILIKSPGTYKLGKLTVNAFVPGTGHSLSASDTRCFYAVFPVALRTMPEKPVIEARDRDGRAAVITFRGEIARQRKKTQNARAAEAEDYACFTVGGKDCGL